LKYYYEKMLVVLSDGPKRNKEIRKAIPEMKTTCLSATVSNRKDLFIRLDKGFVGLKGRDEHLVMRTRFIPDKICLYKKICNIMQEGPKLVQEIYCKLPHEKKTAIRASLTNHPELFFRIKRGYIGRVGRDEYLIERFRRKPKVKVHAEKPISITDELRMVLSTGPKHLHQIYALLPHRKYKSITCKLTLGEEFVRIRPNFYNSLSNNFK